MATDKKSRVQREDKERAGSVESGNSSADASASLHARRAKLRGALGGKAAFASEPFPAAAPAGSFPNADPYAAGQTDPYAGQTDPYAEQAAPYADQTDPYAGQADPYAGQTDPYAGQTDPYAGQTDPYAGQTDPYAGQTDPYGGQSDPYADQTDPYAAHNYTGQQQVPYAAQAQYGAAYGEQADPYAQQQDPYSGQTDTLAGPLGPYSSAPTAYAEETNPDLPVNVYGVPVTETSESTTAEPRRSRRSSASSSASSRSPFEAVPSANLQPLPQIADNTTELINSIDQSLNVCATNLAALQNLAGEQTDVLKGLSQTLQNQTLLEIGLNLNSLTESLTAALEPMKAIGELVPALDSLVSTLESKGQEQNEKMSPEQLVTNLADQLSAGLLDPWTFKCAYMAVYPEDQPADLLHKLVELLGSQRLSGDLFRAAYEAVQAAEPPPRLFASGSGEPRMMDENIRVQLESLEKSNRELQRRQEDREQELASILNQKEAELQSVQEQLNQRLEELNARYADAADMIAAREEEFRAALESKDMDLIEKDAELNMLRAQMEELRVSTEEMGKELQREMAELKLASQQAAASMPAPPAESAAQPGQAMQNSQGFFDNLPQARPQAQNLFDPAPATKGVFSSDSGNFQQDPNYAGEGFGSDSGAGFAPAQNPAAGYQPQPAPQPSFQPPQPAFQPPQPAFQAPPQPSPSAGAVPTGAPAPAPPAPAAPRPGPSPQTTPYAAGQTGSYGIGVRQQVFEVIVRQALAGAPWREICAGPMQVNNISPEEVESEVKRRQSLLNK